MMSGEQECVVPYWNVAKPPNESGAIRCANGPVNREDRLKASRHLSRTEPLGIEPWLVPML